MIALLERHGVRVFSLSDECREVDGYSFWHEGTPYVFLNTMTSAERSRMDAAHELGHLVMHFWGGEFSTRQAEDQAKRFASAFLMPVSGFAGTARPGMGVAQVIKSKAEWRVSAMAYARRLADLDYLSEWQSKVLYRELSAAGYRKREPEPTRRETSSVWRQLLEGLRTNHGMTRSRIAAALGFSAEMLDGLLFGLVLTQLPGGDEVATPAGHEPHDLRLL
jgi:Zn-dependent peptidase ImmA (M78 family)